jgi:hypothetical protein
MTTVRLSDEIFARRRVVFGDPDDVRVLDHREDALFSPGRPVAYLVERAPARALFIFRTATVPKAGSTIVGVSPAVDLVLVASTARALHKAKTALRFLARVRDLDVDALSDTFWLRLADFVVTRQSSRILPQVTELLRAERAPA